MKTITLIIGGVDVSEFVTTSDYSVQKVQKIKSKFENYDGIEITKRAGWSYQIKVSFEDIPDVIMSALTQALDNEGITIKFTDPHSPDDDGCTTATFQRPQSTGGTVSAELDDGLHWDLSVNLNSEFIAATGGDSL